MVDINEAVDLTWLLATCVFCAIAWLSLRRANACKLATKDLPPFRLDLDHMRPTPTAKKQRESSDHSGGFFDFMFCCVSRDTEDAEEFERFLEEKHLDSKYGLPRSELYATEFAPENEDLERLFNVALPAWADRAEFGKRLRTLQERARNLQASGWVQPRDPRSLLRFLVARQGNVEQALGMLHATLEWRISSGADRALVDWDKAPHVALDPHWKCLGIMGHDHAGDPVVWERLGQCHIATLAKISDEWGLRHEIYMQECLMASMEHARRQQRKRSRTGGYNVMIVIDLEGLNMSHANRDILRTYKKLGRMNADYYPEIVKRVLIVRAPWVFPLIWRIVKTFLDKGTIEKVNIVSDKDTRSAILKYVPIECVPQALGGTASTNGDPYCGSVIAAGGPVPDAVHQRYFRSSPPGR